ncbi:MAG: hypothetical protein ABIR26_16990 [Ramlibacter sp.]
MQKKISLLVLLAAGVFGGAAPAGAEAIYRCGNSYSQKPCPDGKMVNADDARSSSQRADTTQAAQRDAKAADVMEKARLKEEGKPAQVSMPPPKAAETPAPRVKPVSKGKMKKPDEFTAVAPKNPDDAAKKKKKKAPKNDA